MIIYPAIDLLDGKVVRLLRGGYDSATVYSSSPVEVARGLKQKGAQRLHIVDLGGARDGAIKELETAKNIKKSTDIFMQIGGGIRTLDAIDAYLSVGADRVILGTAAVMDAELLREATRKYKEKIAVGVDIKNGQIAINGWLETVERDAFDFCHELEKTGVETVICTDISKDGAMQGTNHELYGKLSRELDMNIIASGGISSMTDITKLKKLDIHGAIVGKAYYNGTIDLGEAIMEAKR